MYGKFLISSKKKQFIDSKKYPKTIDQDKIVKNGSFLVQTKKCANETVDVSSEIKIAVND